MSDNLNSEPPKYNKEELKTLLFQVENLQHSRIYYFLVAETFFISAATAVITHLHIFTVLSVAGLLTAAMFTFTNIKLYWRVLWLISQLKQIDPLYDDYINFKTFDRFVTLSPFEKELRGIIESKSNEPVFSGRWHHTGFLYTWGLFAIIGGVWIIFVIYGFYKMGVFRCAA